MRSRRSTFLAHGGDGGEVLVDKPRGNNRNGWGKWGQHGGSATMEGSNAQAGQSTEGAEQIDERHETGPNCWGTLVYGIRFANGF